MSEVETAIIKTLVYGAVFEYPLTAEEIFKYLILSQKSPPRSHFASPSGESFSFNTVAAGITGLVEGGLVGFREGYYFLKGRVEEVEKRKKREKISATKMEMARQTANRLARIPMILGIFVTGTLSMNNAYTDDDIDLMIITKANRLWTTRLLVTAYLEILGSRRRPNTHSRCGNSFHTGSGDEWADKICANMYLDETALAMPENKRNLYTAHEVIQVKPLINKEEIYERFRRANAWTGKYVRTDSV